MSPKKGRPTDAPKTHEIRIRMSDEDVELLEECCKMLNLTKSDVIRRGIREVHEKTK